MNRKLFLVLISYAPLIALLLSLVLLTYTFLNLKDAMIVWLQAVN